MMAHDGDRDQNAPENKGLDLALLFKPVTTVQTSVGKLYLYDLGTLETLSGEEPSARIRTFLPQVASLVETNRFRDERPPLPIEVVNRLSEAEVERVAEIYAEVLLRRSTFSGSDAVRPERAPAEPAVVYLDRLLKHEGHEQSQRLRKMHDKMIASTSSIFDQVRKSSSALGSTLGAFDRLTKGSPAVELRQPNMDHFHAMNEQLARQARERAEELEMVKLTGKMTAESAKTLKDLAEAATVMLEQLDERDQKAEKSTRKQITIAVWSVGVSAVLAALALIVSCVAYYQDKKNNEAGDQLQSDLIAAIRDSGEQRVRAEKAAQQLRDQIAELQAKIESAESAPASVPFDKSKTSAAGRGINPGKSVSAP